MQIREQESIMEVETGAKEEDMSGEKGRRSS